MDEFKHSTPSYPLEPLVESDLKPEDILRAGIQLMEKKGHDYTKDSTKDRYENFDKAAVVISWFDDSIDKAFAARIGDKLARLSALLNKNEEPNFETLEDTFIDLANFSGLWAANREYRRRKRLQKQTEDKMLQAYQNMTNAFPSAIKTAHKQSCLDNMSKGFSCSC